jgi:hypothetical protein
MLGSTFRERLFESAEGAKCNSLGQRPRNKALILEALKARNEVSDAGSGNQSKVHFAPSALYGLLVRPPGALPQAITFRAFGAFKPIS